METDTAIKGPVLQPLVAVPGAASEAIIVQCGAGEPASIIPCSAGDLVPAEISPRKDETPTDSGNVSPPLFPQAMSCTAAKRAGLAYVLRGHPLASWRCRRCARDTLSLSLADVEFQGVPVDSQAGVVLVLNLEKYLPRLSLGYSDLELPGMLQNVFDSPYNGYLIAPACLLEALFSLVNGNACRQEAGLLEGLNLASYNVRIHDFCPAAFILRRLSGGRIAL